MIRSRFERSVISTERSLRFFRNSSLSRPPSQISKRGTITGFSAHSSLRLRQSLNDLTIYSSVLVSFCLTVPWSKRFFDSSPDAYKICFNRFCVSFRRMFPNSGFIFRHELQQRKLPHTHAMSYFSFSDIPNLDRVPESCRDAFLRGFLTNQIIRLWVRALGDTLRSGRLQAVLAHAVKLDFVDDRLNLMRYLSDHTSKHKQSQLGYQGKQWGIVGRSNFRTSDKTVVHFESHSDLLDFTRIIRKVTRYTVFDARCPFGTRHTHRRCVRSISFVDFKTVIRIARFLNRQKLREKKSLAVRFFPLTTDPPS